MVGAPFLSQSPSYRTTDHVLLRIPLPSVTYVRTPHTQNNVCGKYDLAHASPVDLEV
mgnify:CR=1 FL=1